MPHLNQEATSAKSSLILPFVETSHLSNTVLSSALNLLSENLPIESQIIFVGNQKSNLLSKLGRETKLISEVSSELNVEHFIFSNDQTEIVIIDLDKIEPTLNEELSYDDVIISSNQKVIEDATNGNFISFFIAQSASSPQIQTQFYDEGQHRSHVYHQTRSVVGGIGGVVIALTWYEYFPVWFWQGFIWIIIWILMSVVAIYSLASIQTPSFFLNDKRKAID